MTSKKKWQQLNIASDAGIKWAVGVDAETSIPWCHWMPRIERSATWTPEKYSL